MNKENDGKRTNEAPPANIPSPFKVGDRVKCRLDVGAPWIGRIRRIETYPTREAFHVVEIDGNKGEGGFGTCDLTLIEEPRTQEAIRTNEKTSPEKCQRWLDTFGGSANAAQHLADLLDLTAEDAKRTGKATPAELDYPTAFREGAIAARKLVERSVADLRVESAKRGLVSSIDAIEIPSRQRADSASLPETLAPEGRSK